MLRPLPSSLAGSLTQIFESGRPCAKLPVALADLDAVTLGRASKARSGRVTTLGGERRLTLEFEDRRMSVAHAQLRRVHDRWSVEDASSKNGTRVNGRSIDRAILQSGDLVELGRSFFVFRVQAPHRARPGAPEPPPGLATRNPALTRQFEKLTAIAQSSVAIVIEGETGTGKELIARAVHQISARSGPLQAVNCGALSRSLLESELFGYRRGAFSGATEDRPGLIRFADQGTLFLDEVADLPLDGQAALLRVLQEGELVPVGGVKPVPVDVRVIAATHRDLGEMVARGLFRADLLARLAGFQVVLPPLRERREDLGALLRSLLARRETPAVELAPDAIRALHAYAWPGNIRELEKVIVAALILADGPPIELEHLPPSVREAQLPAGHSIGEPDAPAATTWMATTAATAGTAATDGRPERDRLEGLLTRYRGNVNAVAREMRTSRTQVHRLCLRFGIDARTHRDKPR